MLTTYLPAALVSYPIFWSLVTAQHNQVAFRVVLGLALLALVEILAGLWLVHVGNRRHRSGR